MHKEMNTAHFNRILVVDDTTANLQLLTNLLTEHGYTVYPASDGELALEFVRSALPDLILLDIRLPGIDGYEVCRRLKADERTRSVPIIFITILENERDKVKGFQAGAVDYITKPFQPEEVLARVQIHLRLRELTEHLEHKVAARTEELYAANAQLQRELAERVRAEAALKRERTLLANIMETSPIGITTLNVNGQITFANTQAINILGLTKDEITQRMYNAPDWHITDFAGDPFPDEKFPFRQVMTTRQPVYDVQHAIAWSDGRRVLLSINGAPLLNASGDVESVVFALQDITERKWAEDQLRQSEYYKTIQNQIANVFLAIPDEDMYGEVLTVVLQAMKSKFGVFGFIGANRDLVIPSMTRGIWNECQVPDKSIVFPRDTWGDSLWGRAIREKRVLYSDGPFHTPEGHVRIDHFLTAPIIFGNETIGLLSVANKEKGYTGEDRGLLESIAGYISPILNARLQRDRQEKGRKRAEEEREKLQAQFLQAQKMESVGRLAGGVAHDFNNMLGVILGRTEMALDNVDQTQPLFNDLKEIRKAAERSANLTRQLLAFARKQTVAPKVLDLNETVESMLKLLRRLIGEDISLAWMPGAKLWPVKVDPSQIDQILANLCVNARDAIADVGKVTLETGNAVFDEAYCADHADTAAGEYVLLAVSDNGCGMDRKTLDRLFEPFFTTKEVGKGTGLGLATVYGIVRQNNGFINVYSEPGHGTTFRIYLPRHGESTEQMRKESPASPTARGHETILLVEDESTILDVVKLMLESLGYRVLAAPTPDRALRIAGDHSFGIHLLITDVVMPEMTGRDLAEKLNSLRPGLRCLFMSGYTGDVIAHRGVLDEGVSFIQKPFSKQSLAAKVREVLDGK